jgi:hypothetical protein
MKGEPHMIDIEPGTTASQLLETVRLDSERFYLKVKSRLAILEDHELVLDQFSPTQKFKEVLVLPRIRAAGPQPGWSDPPALQHDR